MAHEVFLSHAAGDELLAGVIRNALTLSGIRCYEPASPGEPGTDSVKARIQAITESRILVVIFSSRAGGEPDEWHDPPWEVECAYRLALPIFVVRIEENPVAGALRLPADRVTWLDAFRGRRKRHLRKLVEMVSAVLRPPTPLRFPGELPLQYTWEEPPPTPLSLSDEWGFAMAQILPSISPAHPGSGVPTPPIPTTIIWTSSARGHFEAASDSPRDAVDCTVYAPPEAPAGATVLVQVFAYMPAQADAVRAAAEEFDSSAQRRGVTSLATEIRRGSRLTFELVIPALVVDEPTQGFVWRGQPEAAQFAVAVPEGLRAQTIVGKLRVSQDAVPIGSIKFVLKILPTERAELIPTTVPVGEATRYETAFLSYASKDRPEVLRRAQMLSAAGIRFFQDVLSLEPGDRWEKEIYRHIDTSDVLFLFWSRAAKESKWVEREWRYGLEKKGDDFIRPVPIEGPPPVSPPPELGHLHFNDRTLYVLWAEEAARR